MTINNQPIEWFNQFFPSNIRQIVIPIIKEIDQLPGNDQLLEEKIKEAQEKSQYPFIPLENSEINLHAAIAWNRLNQFSQAEKYLSEALSQANKSSHARMVVLWVLGANAINQDNQSLAFQYWLACRDILYEILAGRTDVILKRDMKDWYQEKKAELNLLMAQNCIREIYDWFCCLENAHLGDEAQALGEKIFQSIIFHNRQETRQLIERVERISSMNRSYSQNREILILTSAAKFLVDDYQGA